MKIFHTYICISFKPNSGDIKISMEKLNYNIIWWNLVFSILRICHFKCLLFSLLLTHTAEIWSCLTYIFGVSLAVMTLLREFCSYFSRPSFNGFSQGPIKSQHFCCCPPLPYREDNACPFWKENTQHGACTHLQTQAHTEFSWTDFAQC